MTHTFTLRVASALPLLTLVACSSTASQTEAMDTDGMGMTTSPSTSGTPTSAAGPTATTGASTSAGPTSAGPSTTTGATTTATATTAPSTSTATGGDPTGVGGAPTTTDGGTTSVGGAATSAGGAATATTGDSGTTGGPGNWGVDEDPGASCSVSELPAAGSLTANNKLPDPFTKLDGTRIADKSEWLCRREEILQSAYEYIYGEKPVPEEGSVTGTVSNTAISVQATGPEGTASFNLTISMNGATAPAPAIIYYDGGLGSPLPIPNGVASIKFTAVEASGGDGPKSGPFYDAYGEDHPLGMLPAQAWQISRVLDLLEQNPDVIDPHRIGLTGCSRNGKGAFVGGVLDNRIALTIPVESGIGGTVALRLVEVLDSYSGSEWPYHAISYVRWLSEVQLGQFTNGNSASADNTDKVPVDMHEMMALIAPRGLLILDNPSTMYNGLDRNGAYVTAAAGKMAFEALGVGDHMSYQAASGSHCQWRGAYDPPLTAMIDKFLKGNDAASTGTFASDLPNQPNAGDHVEWANTEIPGEL